MRGSVNYSIADISYEDPRYNDRVNQLISGEINYQWTDKTQPYLRGGIGIDEDEGLDGDAEKPFGLIGVRHEMTEKIDLDFAAGYEQYSRTPLEGDLAGVELTDDGIKWLARLNYRIFHKTLITASGRTGFNSVASSGSSSREETSASVAITHQTTPQIDQRASLAWRFDDYITPLPTKEGLLDEEKETLYYQYRIHYQTVRPWLTLYASLSYEDGSSKIPGDSYTETEITVGVKARY
jgi:hypothetical protein